MNKSFGSKIGAFIRHHFWDLVFYGVLAMGTAVSGAVLSFAIPFSVKMLLLPIAIFEGGFLGFETISIYKKIKSFTVSDLS